METKAFYDGFYTDEENIIEDMPTGIFDSESKAVEYYGEKPALYAVDLEVNPLSVYSYIRLYTYDSENDSDYLSYSQSYDIGKVFESTESYRSIDIFCDLKNKLSNGKLTVEFTVEHTGWYDNMPVIVTMKDNIGAVVDQKSFSLGSYTYEFVGDMTNIASLTIYDCSYQEQTAFTVCIDSLIFTEMDEDDETNKNILETIKDFFGNFFDNLINSVVGLFIPSEAEMTELFNQLDTFFTNTFGFLYYPFEFFIDLVDALMTTNTDVIITFPGFSIMGYEVWPDYDVNITDNEVAQSIFAKCRTGTSVLCFAWFVGYLRNYYDKRFGGGGQ